MARKKQPTQSEDFVPSADLESFPSETQETGEAAILVEEWHVLVLVDNEGRTPFESWYSTLRDRAAKARIAARLTRILQGGNFGAHRERIAGAVSELKIDYGPGYRIYYVRVGELIIVLVGGGIKDTQQNDIERAVTLWEQYKDEIEEHSRKFAC